MTLVVLNINNLTDGRYYAARGVEYMTFQFPNNSEEAPAVFKKIQDILEWVEGVKVLLHCNSENINLAQTLEIPFEVTGFVIPYDVQIDALKGKIFYDVPLSTHKILTKLNKSLKKIPTESNFFFTWHGTTDAFDKFGVKVLQNEKLLDITLFHNIFVQIPIDSESTSLLMQSLFPDGILISAGEETIVGEKNYDAEDAFLDELEENESI